MPRIQANRDSIDDRFSVLGFTVRTESPLFEVAIATDPSLFRAEQRAQRTRRNFYSSRGNGVIRAPRGEAVYLVPPDVLASFVGQPRLYFGLATYRENSRGRPDFVQNPGEGTMYVNLSGLTERGLRRLTGTRGNGASYGPHRENDASLEWGGDAVAQPPGAAGDSSAGTAAARPAAPAPYDDGFGSFPAGGGSDTAVATEPARTATNAPGTARSPSAPAMAPVAVATELLFKPYSGGDGGLLEQLAFLAGSVPWFAGVSDTSAFPHSAICRVLFTDASGDHAVGTAFYVGRNVLLTAAHVVEDMSSLTIVPGRNGSGRDSAHEPFGRFTVTPTDWVMHESYVPGRQDFDFAVIRASRAAPHDRWFPLEELRESRPEGIVVCGYSTESRQSDILSRLVNYTINPEKQHMHSGHVRFFETGETFDYDVQSLPGASGSPVYTIFEGEPPAAMVCGVHVAGGTETTNQGCRLTDAKIAWIRAKAAHLGVASPMSVLRTGRARRPATPPKARAQGMFDLLPVDLKMRVFIPAPAVMVTNPGVGGSMPFQDSHGGDGRGFQAEGGTSRAEVTAKFHFGSDGARPSLSDVSRTWGESKLYDLGDTAAVAGKPEWWRSLNEGAQPKERGRRELTGDNLGVALGGSANDGIVSMAERSVVTTFDIHGANPLVTGSPDIDGRLAVLLKVDGDRVKARVRGGHDEFPAYEIYANGHLVYAYDPVASGGTPWGLFGDGNWDVNPETDYVDVGPATEYRIIGPVTIGGAQAQALSAISRAQSASRAMSGQSVAIHWDTVPYYPQAGSNSCWAASAAMIVGWRDGRTVTDSEIAQKVPVFDAYRTGLFPTDRQALADAWNLVPEPPASYTIDTWAELLRTCGPLYIDMTASPKGGGHVRVLVGLQSDGAPDGSDTTMFMHDPSPGSAGRIRLTFREFLALYEGRTGNAGGHLQYQILHSGRVPAGRHSVAAAPFALTTAEAVDAGTNVQPDTPLQPLPPPAPIVQQMQVEARALIAPAAVIVPIATTILGATMTRIMNNVGDITWELDQLRGFKHPNDTAPSPMPAAHDGETIRLTDWPKFTNHLGDEISAGFEINWQYNGASLGNVMISNIATNDAVGWGLTVKANIMDDNIVYPPESPAFAAMRVRFEYRFTRFIGGDYIATQDVHLFGNGRYNVSGEWRQQG